MTTKNGSKDFTTVCGTECQIVEPFNPLVCYGCVLCVDRDGNRISTTHKLCDSHFRLASTKCPGQKAYQIFCKGCTIDHNQEKFLVDIRAENRRPTLKIVSQEVFLKMNVNYKAVIATYEHYQNVGVEIKGQIHKDWTPSRPFFNCGSPALENHTFWEVYDLNLPPKVKYLEMSVTQEQRVRCAKYRQNSAHLSDETFAERLVDVKERVQSDFSVKAKAKEMINQQEFIKNKNSAVAKRKQETVKDVFTQSLPKEASVQQLQREMSKLKKQRTEGSSTAPTGAAAARAADAAARAAALEAEAADRAAAREAERAAREAERAAREAARASRNRNSQSTAARNNNSTRTTRSATAAAARNSTRTTRSTTARNNNNE